MPIYEYKCDQCEAIVEALQKFSDAPLTACPHCQGTLQKLISQSAFHLKGSGWYVTDYADKPKAAAEPAKPENDAKPAAAATGDTGDTGA